MLLSKCAMNNSGKLRLIKEQESGGLLNKSGLKIPMLADISRDKFMPEMYLRQPRFTYSACGPFNKNLLWRF